jgi:hypothetical protein
MYAWIWRKLPFGRWGKLTGSFVLVTAAVSLLWFVVFPWATPLLPFDDVQVGSESSQQDQQGRPDGGADPDAPAEDEAPEDIPYSTHSNEPAPSNGATPTSTTPPSIPGN